MCHWPEQRTCRLRARLRACVLAVCLLLPAAAASQTTEAPAQADTKTDTKTDTNADAKAPAPEKHCASVLRRVCRQKPKRVCREVMQNDCSMQPENVCKDKFVETCRRMPKSTCTYRNGRRNCKTELKRTCVRRIRSWENAILSASTEPDCRLQRTVRCRANPRLKKKPIDSGDKE